MKDNAFDKDKEVRFRHWLEIYRRDIGAKAYTDWVRDIKISRYFRENELKKAMRLLGANNIADDREYWYADCGVNRIEDFHLGRMLMSGIMLSVKEDTAFDSEENENTLKVKDVLQEAVRSEEFLSAMEDFGGDYITDGTAVLVHRADASLDPKTGAPKICFEYADALEFVLDSQATSLRDTRHRFRIRRRSPEELSLDYGQKITADKMDMYYSDEGIEYGDDYKPDDNLTDFLEVQFVRRRKVFNYIFQPEIAEKYGIPEVMSEDEYEEIYNVLFEQVAPEEWIEVSLDFETAEKLPHIITEYYYDCFANGKSLLDAPKPMVWDSSLTPDGWGWTIQHHKRRSGTPYGIGIVKYQRDKLMLRIMIMTIAMRAISRYKDQRNYISRTQLSDTKEQMRIRRGEGGVYFVDGEARNAEWSPHDQPVDPTLLNYLQYIDDNIRAETGVTLEQTSSPFAGASGVAIDILQRGGNTQLAMRLDKFFRTMITAIKKHYVLMREYQGLLEIPDLKLEIKFDEKTQQEKDVEGQKAIHLYQLNLLPGAETLRKNGYGIESEEYQQRRQAEDIGNIVMQDPELAQLVQAKIQGGQGQQTQ